MGTVEVTYTRDQWIKKQTVISLLNNIGNLHTNLIVQGDSMGLVVQLELPIPKEVYDLSCIFKIYNNCYEEINRSQYIFAKTAVSQSHGQDPLKTVISYTVPENPLLGHGLKIQCNVTILDSVNKTIFEKMKFSDVNFRVQGKDFSAHKSFLTARSKVFEAMFDHQMAESETNNIIVEDISHDVFQELLRFIYTGSVTNLNMLAMELFGAADKYQLEDLKKLCEDAIIKNMSVENACELLILADNYRAAFLKSSAIKFINTTAKAIRTTLNWKEFSESHPKLVLELYYASVDSED